jgi:hypothetical protein
MVSWLELVHKLYLDRFICQLHLNFALLSTQLMLPINSFLPNSLTMNFQLENFENQVYEFTKPNPCSSSSSTSQAFIVVNSKDWSYTLQDWLNWWRLWWLMAISFQGENELGFSKGKIYFSLQLWLKTFGKSSDYRLEISQDSGSRLESRWIWYLLHWSVCGIVTILEDWIFVAKITINCREGSTTHWRFSLSIVV